MGNRKPRWELIHAIRHPYLSLRLRSVYKASVEISIPIDTALKYHESVRIEVSLPNKGCLGHCCGMSVMPDCEPVQQ